MSLIYRIHKIIFDKDMFQDENVREQWLNDRKLKIKYSNEKKQKLTEDGHFVYKQKSKTSKHDCQQQVRCCLETGVFAIGEYHYPKFKQERTKKQDKEKEQLPESQ